MESLAEISQIASVMTTTTKNHNKQLPHVIRLQVTKNQSWSYRKEKVTQNIWIEQNHHTPRAKNTSHCLVETTVGMNPLS